MRLLIEQPRTMSSGSSNFLLVPIPEYPALDCVPNKNVKIVVLGANNVGKTALIVRFLTKRFIGDYEANTGALYSRKINLDGEQVSLQVQDTPCVSLQDDAEGLYCQEQINRSIYWADGYVTLLRSFGKGEPRERSGCFSAPVSGGEPSAGRRKWGEEKRRVTPCQAKEPKHARVEEKISASAVIQGEVGYCTISYNFVTAVDSESFFF
ncbi:ras-like protein family member 11A-like isoform X2 [Paramisgurnus dabryanus]|uniref:ras-like protein family member 11A-like isoform X2 n=1 Tax=Paramisgurnus dabryanus TaxID=90735 RepID=UPI0031F42DD7